MFEKTLGAAMFMAVASMSAASAEESKGDDQAGLKDHLILNVRLRQEWVDQAGFSKNAYALTVRTRFGFETPRWKGFSVLVEGENVAHLTDEFNDTVNGLSAYPVVADPDATELNRAQLSFTGSRNAEIVAGRQWLALDDERFLGSVGFRQNDQTFDAIKVSTGQLAPVTIEYAYIDRVHRVFGDDHPLGEFDSSSHVIEARKVSPIGTVAVYGLLLDFDNAPALSSATYGARLTGKHRGVAYRLEYARQEDYRSNPASFELSYFRATADLVRERWTFGGGVEILGGDGANAFQTPLATLHKFQGFADAFLSTPSEGLRDFFIHAEYRWPQTLFGGPVKLGVAAHDFQAEEGSADLGSEFDLLASYEIARGLSFEAKAAFLDGGGAGPADRTKVWLVLTFDL